LERGRRGGERDRTTGGSEGGETARLPRSRRLTVSMSLRVSVSCVLSLISDDAIHDLIWSRSLWSFLICVLRSVSHFSFWVAFVEAFILSKIDSKSSTPSVTFLRVLSISPRLGRADELRASDGRRGTAK
jgi:hypothetical protein